MRPAKSVLVLTALVGIAACEREGTPDPLAPERVEARAALPSAADESMGALVVHDETVFGFTHFDAKRKLMSVHGWIVQACQGLPITTTPRMIVTTPSEISQQLFRIGEDEQPAVIYRTETPVVTCGLVTSPEARVASGMVRHDQTFTLASFQATWRGDVTAPDGSTHHLTEVYQLGADIHDPTNPNLWSVNASKILIN